MAINKPTGSGSDFFCYKKFTSVVLLAIVDANYRLLWIFVSVFYYLLIIFSFTDFFIAVLVQMENNQTEGYTIAQISRNCSKKENLRSQNPGVYPNHEINGVIFTFVVMMPLDWSLQWWSPTREMLKGPCSKK